MLLGDGNEAVRSLGAPKVGSRSQSSHGNDQDSFNEHSRKKGLEECLPVQQVPLLFSASRCALQRESIISRIAHVSNSLAKQQIRLHDLSASHHRAIPNPVPRFVDAFAFCFDLSLIQVAGS
jgi:hypothetical protein